ncbi:hypothetical protein [Nocardioides sp. W7]|uniref:hypothetical protein n=1 Tax=Nocardioides sp. W7 TaxID=2931390 RepID=UPI001FD01D17|nr:hypothetical protein [Nocardioides sp. W7]
MRATTSGWRDPRLWVGVAIVAVSVVAGARLLGAADDTVRVWAVAADIGPGDRLAESELVARRVRFADEADLDGYFTVDDELPADLELTRGVGDGELLPRGAVAAAGDRDRLELPVSVDPALVPASVRAGSVVSVYLSAPGSAGGAGGAGVPDAPGPADGLLLDEATVVDAPPVASGFSASGRRQLVLAVAEADVERYFDQLGAVENPVLTVVRRG